MFSGRRIALQLLCAFVVLAGLVLSNLSPASATPLGASLVTDAAAASNASSTLSDVPGASRDRETARAGSVPIGDSSYPVPSGALFVSPTGSDSAAGDVKNPLRTLGAAVARARTGATIVLREGTYHESVTVPKEKALTLQSYPNEAVWLDGSSAVAGFVRSGSGWVKSGWNVAFDSSPTHARGAADSNQAGWQWINPAYPMAAHPDQVWIDGVAQKQVGSSGELVPGSFYVDYGTKQLHLGSDPTGKSVRASDLVLGLTVLSPGSTIRGLGVRRYAPSVPDLGAMRLFGADGSTVENVVVADNATLGLNIGSKSVRMRNVTSSGNGQMGIGSNYADGLDASGLRVDNNNTEHFNGAPSAGGYKFSRSRHVTITDSVFSNNVGSSGLWFDESSFDLTITRNDMQGNGRHGLIVELSASADLVNNAIWGNDDTGFMILDSNNVRAWNNSIRGGLLPVRIADGPRVATNLSTSGHDKRQPLPDPQVTWVTSNIEFKNNVVGDAKQGVNGSNWCGIVCVLDDQRQATAASMNAQVDGNVYYRASANALPKYVLRWAGGTQGALNFRSLDEFQRSVGQEANGTEVLGTSRFAANGVLVSATGLDAGVPIPVDIASIGRLKPGTPAKGRIKLGPAPSVTAKHHLAGVKAPTIGGNARVGKKLKIKSRGRWTVAPTTYSYRWLRNGKPIKNAKGRTYKLTKKDRGRAISVRVTAKRAGYSAGRQVSKNRRV